MKFNCLYLGLLTMGFIMRSFQNQLLQNTLENSFARLADFVAG